MKIISDLNPFQTFYKMEVKLSYSEGNDEIEKKINNNNKKETKTNRQTNKHANISYRDTAELFISMELYHHILHKALYVVRNAVVNRNTQTSK